MNDRAEIPLLQLKHVLDKAVNFIGLHRMVLVNIIRELRRENTQNESEVVSAVKKFFSSQLHKALTDVGVPNIKIDQAYLEKMFDNEFVNSILKSIDQFLERNPVPPARPMPAPRPSQMIIPNDHESKFHGDELIFTCFRKRKCYDEIT